jgi:serine/threonine-protein kinase
MLMGEPPFTGPTPQAILARCLSGERPRMRVVRPGVPDGIERVVTRALAPVAADRYSTAAEFIRALVTGAVAPASTAIAERSARAAKPNLRTLAFLFAGVLSLLAGWASLVWQRGRTSSDGISSGPTRLAVLPFENLGRPEDEYIVDGMTDEVRGRLAALPSLRVIARASSSHYKGTGKDLQEIGKELGAQYLLTGTVRWDRSEEANRIRVSPELVQASDASTRWQQPFDAALTDVFVVQGQIASQVAQALNIALGAEEKQTLRERPTASLPAYEAFLRGEAAGGALNTSYGNLQRVSGFYEQAVALDSTFAQAWAQLARARARMYSVAQYTDVAATKRAAERAMALAPDDQHAHLALGDYYYHVLRDNPRALQTYQQALKLSAPGADLLIALALAEQSLGRWEAALSYLERARELDPRSVPTANQLVLNLLRLRRYDEALLAADRALALDPSDLSAIQGAVQAHLIQGDLEGARTVLREVPSTVPLTAVVAMVSSYGDYYWVLEEPQQRLLLRLAPSAFADQRFIWAIALAETYHLRGELANARAYADSARLELEPQLRSAPDDAQRLALLGLALAYLGRKARAISVGEKAAAMLPITIDRTVGAYVQHQLVRIYILVGEHEKALDRLEPLLRIPYDLSPGVLRIDPNFDPLRNHPRFQRLLAGNT